MFDIRERVLRGDFVAGTWCSLNSPAAAEITGLCGFDWALLDSEHAPTTTAGLMAQMQALSRFLTAPIVRIPWLDRVAIKWSLDIGAAGIMVPYVETEEQAREAVSFMRYAPEGVRGVAGATRASDFGFGFKDYFAESNKRLLTVAQMETQLAVDNSRAIAAVDGVDVLFVGPMDLSASLNLPERFADPAFMDVLQLVSDNARSEGIIKAAQQNQDFAAQTPETTAPQPDAAANDVTRQFQGLPMTEIIGGPLQAAAEAQTRQAETAADFINQLQIKQQATPEKPAKPQINQIYRPKRIQLFPAPQPNHD